MSRQPPPEPGQETVKDKVLADINGRAEYGKAVYGTYLMAHNGRDALLDAYHEALDLTMYLAQAIMERNASKENAKEEEVE